MTHYALVQLKLDPCVQQSGDNRTSQWLCNNTGGRGAVAGRTSHEMRWINWQTTVELQSSTDRQTDRQTDRHPTYKLSNARFLWCTSCSVHTHKHTKSNKPTSYALYVCIRPRISLFISKLLHALHLSLQIFFEINLSMINTKRLATGWTVRRSNPGGGQIFRTRPDRPWAHPASCATGTGFLSGGKAAGAWRWPPTPSSFGVKKE